MEQLFDDLEDFGAFDDAVSGDVRDPYTELARLRREEPVQRLDSSGMPHEESKPVFIVYRHEEAQQMLRDNETFSSAGWRTVSSTSSPRLERQTWSNSSPLTTPARSSPACWACRRRTTRSFSAGPYRC